MADSIFTKIIKGEVPANKLYEDDKTIVILNLYPDAPGHTLVIPKKQVEQLWDLPDDDYKAVMATCKKMALHLREKLQTLRVGVKVIGESVPHAHVHLVPFNDHHEYLNMAPQVGEPDYASLAAMAKKLAF